MSGNKIYVGNLAYTVTEEALNKFFQQYGPIKSVTLIVDRDSGRSKGFGFVEFESDDSAQKAIQGANGFQLEGRAMNVNIARDKDSSGGGGRRPSHRPHRGGRAPTGGFSNHGSRNRVRDRDGM